MSESVKDITSHYFDFILQFQQFLSKKFLYYILNISLKERGEMLQYWKLKYEEDTIKINDHVIQQREKLRMTIARRQELQKLVIN